MEVVHRRDGTVNGRVTIYLRAFCRDEGARTQQTAEFLELGMANRIGNGFVRTQECALRNRVEHVGNTVTRLRLVEDLVLSHRDEHALLGLA